VESPLAMPPGDEEMAIDKGAVPKLPTMLSDEKLVE
jgi:hypothetical protein